MVRERQHDPQDQPSDIGAQVELVLDRHERPARPVDPLDVLQRVAQRPAEAIELGDDDAAAHAGFDTLDRLHQQRSVGTAPRRIELFEDAQQSRVIQTAPRLDPLPLIVG